MYNYIKRSTSFDNSNKPFTRLGLGGRPPKWADELLSIEILRHGYIAHNNCDHKYIFTWEDIKGYVDLGGCGLSYVAPLFEGQ